jgi:hypothetical protein
VTAVGPMHAVAATASTGRLRSAAIAARPYQRRDTLRAPSHRCRSGRSGSSEGRASQRPRLALGGAAKLALGSRGDPGPFLTERGDGGPAEVIKWGQV